VRGGVFKRGKTSSYTVYVGRDSMTGKKRYNRRGGFGTGSCVRGLDAPARRPRSHE